MTQMTLGAALHREPLIDQRSANRRREHAAHGWAIHHGTSSFAGVIGKVGCVFMRCPCGWYGWVASEAAK